MDFLERANPDYLRARELGNSYNDWLAPGNDDTPHQLLATAYWAYDAALMAEIADATGRAGEAAGYRALRAKLRSAFIGAFVAAGVGYLLPVLSSARHDAVAYRLLEQDTVPSWHRRLRPAPAPAAPRRITGLGPRILRIRPGNDQGRLETGPQPVHVPGGTAAQRHGHHPHPQPPRRPGPRRRG